MMLQSRHKIHQLSCISITNLQRKKFYITYLQLPHLPSLEVSLTKDMKHFFNEQLKIQRQWKAAHSMLLTLQK